MMDIDLDFTFAPSGTIYGARAIKLDIVTQGGCYLGSYNSMCVGITPQQSQQAPGLVGNTTPPLVLADTTNGGNVPVYGPGRRCLIDVDPDYGGRIRPGDLIISSNSGYARRASPFGPWNQWIIGIALSFANSGQSLNVKVVIFPWSPTGS
jgi:hypothetical protein